MQEMLDNDFYAHLLWVCLPGEVMVCVLDFRREMGLWHGILSVGQLFIRIRFELLVPRKLANSAYEGCNYFLIIIVTTARKIH